MFGRRPTSRRSRLALPAGLLLLAFAGGSGLVLPSPADAGYVQGYTRKDGTYVHPYYRKSPTGYVHLPSSENRRGRYVAKGALAPSSCDTGCPPSE